MTNENSTNTLRLKFKNKFIEIRVICENDSFYGVSVVYPGTSFEKSSFSKITSSVNDLVKSGATKKLEVTSRLNRLVNVDRDILKFMVGVVDKYLPLK